MSLLPAVLNQDRYRQWAAGQPLLPVFQQPWWLDAQALRADWQVLAVQDSQGRIGGAWPYFRAVRAGRRRLIPPPWQLRSGPWLTPDAQRRKCLRELLKALPHYHQAEFTGYPQLLDYTPLAEAGWTLRLRYTYSWEVAADEQTFWNQLSKDQRNKWSRAPEAQFSPGLPPEMLHSLMQATWRRQGLALPVEPERMARVLQACTNSQQGAHWRVHSPNGQTLWGALVVVWDQQRLYLLQSDLTEAGRTARARDAMLRFLLREARQRGLARVDLLGSMQARIAQKYRELGAELEPVVTASHIPDRLLRTYLALRGRL